ncbi:hypothetical protein [Roseomonas haemaphysalidis]|uniref:Lipoprotein n=1 Tax=Roseomonas haemaphysalidis TaxID=2768162 RepID=A0ABS3KUY1_9PROT|nr:hypothetical protein [Roseomonas haemaphysalidis]MBO1080750.1 hypothetical protein [Roseomonas haemaphysalidis]
MRRAAPLLAAGLLLSGCGSLGGIVGGVSGTTTGIATGNAAVGYAVGVGIRAVVDSTVKYVQRNMARSEQDSIAATAGAIPVGTVADWKVEHALPFGIGDAEGQVQVTRVIDNALTNCREVAVTVVDGKDIVLLITTACRQPDGRWGWAGAEPSVDRWGALQR